MGTRCANGFYLRGHARPHTLLRYEGHPRSGRFARPHGHARPHALLRYEGHPHIKTSRVIGAPDIHTITVSFGQMEDDASDKRIAFMLQDVEAQSPYSGYTAVVHIKTFRVIGAPAIHSSAMSLGQMEADASDKCIALMLQDVEAQSPYGDYTAVVRIKT